MNWGPSKVALLASAIVSQVAVLYASAGAGPRDFGRIHSSALRAYLLATAALCVAALWGSVLLLLLDPVYADEAASHLAAAACLLVYNGLQVLFLPSVRVATEGNGSRWPARALLALCTLPVAALVGLAASFGEAPLVLSTSAALAHVVLNDAVLFGFLF